MEAENCMSHLFMKRDDVSSSYNSPFTDASKICKMAGI